jgi:beta-glucosidase-like glycosyl hydrolase
MLKYGGIIDAPLHQKLYHLIIDRLEGKDIQNPHYQDKIVRLVDKGIGGFILFGGRRDEVKDFVKRLQALAEIPLFIASDVERGVGQQVDGTTFFPCQMAMAAATDRFNPYDVSILEQAIQAVACEAGDVGINMPLIPVLDVNQNPDNPIICTRAFSDDPEVVTWFGLKYIETLEKSGLVSCAKHFPGHGDTAIDSHISLPVIRKSYEELLGTDIMPFRAAVSHGVSSIMVGHLSLPAIDSMPASLSKEIHALLRGTLGFEGLILTDALTMSALDHIPDVGVRCLNAGADILLHPSDPDETVKTLSSALLSGHLHEDQIDAVLTRIIRRKAMLPALKTKEIDCQSNSLLSSQLSEKSISPVRISPGILPILGTDDIHIFLAGDREPADRSPLGGLSANVRMLDEPRDSLDLHNSVAIIALYTSVAAWKGSAGIAADEREQIREIIRRAQKSIVISFGNPYVLRHFPDSDILVAAYESTEQAQKTVVTWLRDSKKLEGRIPVRLLF